MIKEDWSSLMFSSDDSLFDEMTKQLEDDTTRPKTDKKSSPSATSTITATSTSMQDQETLPDIVYTSSRTDAATGLLMLGTDPKDLDAEIDNKLVMPVNKPTQQNHNNLSTGDNNNNNNKITNEKRRNEIVIEETLPGGQFVKPVNQSLLHPKLLQPQAFSRVHHQVLDLPGEYWRWHVTN